MSKTIVKPRSKKKNRSPSCVVYAHVPQALGEALKAAAADHRRKITAEIIMALEAYLKGLGRWPAVTSAAITAGEDLEEK